MLYINRDQVKKHTTKKISSPEIFFVRLVCRRKINRINKERKKSEH